MAALLLAACGGGSAAGSGSLSGAPYAFDVKSAFHVYSKTATADQNAQFVEIGLVDQAWSCDDLKAHTNSAPSHFVLVAVSGAGTAVAPGDFTIDPSATSTAAGAVEASSTTSSYTAVSGTITLTAVSATGNVTGSFQSSDGTNSLSGNFDAAPCDALGG